MITDRYESENKTINSSRQERILKTLDIPELSKDVYRDYVILWKDLDTVSNKYGISKERVKLIVLVAP